jgi:S1-C subfamily serine protease
VAGCHAISLWPASGQEQPAHILASDARIDIALLSTGDLGSAASTHAASNPQPGEPVSTIGFGVRRSQPREAVVTDGTVIGEAMSDAGNQILLIEASLPEGNSGGPVIDVWGSLVGVVTGRDAARPDLGVAAPSSQIDQFLLRQGIGPMSNFPGEGRPADRATLLKAMSVLVQCAPGHAGSAGHRP